MLCETKPRRCECDRFLLDQEWPRGVRPWTDKASSQGAVAYIVDHRGVNLLLKEGEWVVRWLDTGDIEKYSDVDKRRKLNDLQHEWSGEP